MTNFKVGQKVVAFGNTDWESSDFEIDQSNYPKNGEIVTIDGFDADDCDYMFLREYPRSANGNRQVFYQGDFRPLQFKSASSEILAKFPLTEENSDIEIKELEIA